MHGAICLSQERGRAGPPPTDRHTQAGCGGDERVTDPDSRRQSRANLLGQRGCQRFIGQLRVDDGEFVAAKMGYIVGVGAHISQSRGNPAQVFIPPGDTQTVVDGAKVVEVQHHQRRALVCRPIRVQLVGQFAQQ